MPTHAFRPSYVVLAAITLATAWTSAAAAHDFFLLPNDFTPPTGEMVTVKATVSAAFPKVESAVAPERMGEKLVLAGGVASPLSVSGTGPDAALAYRAVTAGDAVLAVVLPPRDVDYPHDRISLILEEYDIGGGPAAAVRALPYGAPLRVSSARFAKAALCIGSCRDVDDLRRPAGLALEFVATGEARDRFVLLADGKPLPNHPVALVAADGKRVRATTDAAGVMSLDAGASGVTMVFAALMTEPSQPGGRFALRLTTLTLER